MYSSFVIYTLISVALASAPIFVSECGVLESPYATYQLSKDIMISDSSYGFVCFDIKGDGITLEGNGFKLSSATNELLPATGVQYSGSATTVSNLHIENLRTGIRAKGKYGKVDHNTIKHAVNGIDVSATYNEISNNIIGSFNADESTSGIYVYFPARTPIASFINITNNVISDIRGYSFVLGISVYYATSVYIAHNRIFNLAGNLSSEDISIIQGNADLHNNIFSPPIEGSLSSVPTFLLSCVAVLASLAFLRRTSASRNGKNEGEQQKEEKEVKDGQDKEVEEELEKDGADEVPALLN